MKKLIFLLLCLPGLAFSQFSDVFEDGDLNGWTESVPGHWAASGVTPINGTYSLKHVIDTSVAWKDMISHPLNAIDLSAGTATWQFQVRYGYNPSSSNYWAVFLSSDADALQVGTNNTANGYILGVNYSGSTDLIKMWKITNGTASEILNTNFDWQTNITIAGTCGFKITRTPSGNWDVSIDQNGGFDNLLSIGSVSETTFTIAAHFLIYHAFTSSADQLLWVDDIDVTYAPTNTNDKDSKILNPDIQIVQSSISSLATDSASAIDLFKVKLKDLASSDTVPTYITQLKITNAATTNAALWTSTIGGILLHDGISYIATTSTTISDNSIIINIPMGNLSVPSGDSLELTFSAFLKNSGLADGSVIQLKIDSVGHGWACDTSGSSFSPVLPATITSSPFQIAVQGTQLALSNYPSSTAINADFSATVSLTDGNGNTDIDTTVIVNLGLGHGDGNLTSFMGLSQSISSGSFTWTDLQYDMVGDFTLQVVDANSVVNGATSDTIVAMLFYSLVSDDFTDGDVSTNPEWLGDTSSFDVNTSLELELVGQAGISDIVHLSVPIAVTSEKHEWQLYFRIGSSPSTNNFIHYYLIADQSNLEIPLEGFFIRAGETGSADALELFYQSGTTYTSICRGTDSLVAVQPEVRVKVTRDTTGLWEIFADYTGGTDFQYEAGGTNSNMLTGLYYSGIFTQYSSTYAQGNFFFDDYYYGPPIVRDNDSEVGSPGLQVPGTTISSLATAPGSKVDVFKFEIDDFASLDTLPTIVTKITIKNYAPANGANWSASLAGLTLNDGTSEILLDSAGITDNQIVLYPTSGLSVPSGNTAAITMSAYLANSGLPDGGTLQFYIDSVNHGMQSSQVGSSFNSQFPAKTISELFTIDVVATSLNLYNYPTSVGVALDFTISASASDSNGNIDRDNQSPVTLSKSFGSGILSSVIGLTQNLTNGSTTWTDVQYSTPGLFMLSLSGGAFSSVFSDSILAISYPSSLYERFDDGDFTSDPTWSGDASFFSVDPDLLDLQLTSPNAVADTAYLSIQVNIPSDSIEWQALINIETSPSTSNYCRYYLMANDADLENPLNGYFIRIGESGSIDALELFRQNGTSTTSICRGTDSLVAVQPNVRIKVVRNSVGLWKLYADYSGEYSFQYEGSGVDTTYFSHLFATGVYCKYTTTNAEGVFHFDDLYTGRPQRRDEDSYVSSPVSPIASGEVSSLLNTESSAKEVFKFVINDPGTSDSIPTYVTQLTIKNAQPANSASWISNIAGVTLSNGSPVPIDTIIITNSNIRISVSNDGLIIPDNDSVEITMSVFLNTGTLEDGKVLQFSIDANQHGFASDIQGSAFDTSFASNVQSEQFTITVTASQLEFSDVPEMVGIGLDFSATVAAVDAYGNKDTDASINIMVSNDFGNGSVSSVSGLSGQTSSGIHNWNDLNYDASGYFRLIATDSLGNLSPGFSNYINAVFYPSVLFDDFTDGNFTNDPTWYGNTGDFIVNPMSKELELFASQAGTSFLVSPVKITADSIEWQLFTQLKISPSNGNCVKYYLTSDNDKLNESLNGYYIQIGEDESTDAVELFYQSGNTKQSICRGPNGLVAVNPEVRLKIIYRPGGNWEILADHNGNQVFINEASGTSAALTDSIFYTGILTTYTGTNIAQKFFFDDVYVGPVQVDTTPPSLTRIRVLPPNQLELYFSEIVDEVPAETSANYEVLNIGNPFYAYRDASNPALVHLSFSSNFPEETENILVINNIADEIGNIAPEIRDTFYFYQVKPFDVVINEIMTDIDPIPYGIPAAEYVELHNTTDYDLDLTAWSIELKLNDTRLLFEEKIIPAKGFLILCDDSKAIAMSPYGMVQDFSSFSLNSETDLTLRDSSGTVIHAVSFTTKFYHNTFKDDGGWSMELIDPENPCAGENNWKASSDSSGGTPGKVNSVFGSFADLYSPQLTRASIVSSDTIRLHFDESINPLTLLASDIVVDHDIGNPISIIPVEPYFREVMMTFSAPFDSSIIYLATVTLDSVSDCVGNTVENVTSVRFALAHPIDSLDLIINEVLFNPYTNGVDFVEIYNKSSKTHDLKDLLLSSRKTDDLSFNYTFIVRDDGYLIFPGEYLALTSDGSIVKQQYYTPDPNNIVTIPDIPSYSDDEGYVVLQDKWLGILDEFHYLDWMHFALISDVNGISLERVDFNRPTNEAANWHSAAENVGFATPAYKNSQFKQTTGSSDEFTIEPELFSPDNDGFDDVLNIHYLFETPGKVANIKIFDARGRYIRNLVSSELLATSGTISWDGLNEDSHKVNMGMYMLYIEIFEMDGTVKVFKEVCVVAGKFE